ncbi:MAG: basic amino acid ABC transporter substrate-binding protein [Coriobacteriia bacterium]|nr:basic amino acid ABC transporter substrate-binding protein [Coriobacteriia bacterium]
MSKARKLLSLMLALALVAMMFAVAGCGGTAEEPADETPAGEEPAADLGTLTPGKIIVGSDTAYPPFENVVNGVTVGFDVDMMNEVGKRLGYEVEFKTYKFDALITGMQAGTEFDMIASAMTIKPDRAEKVDFSDPYINSNQSLAVVNDSPIKTVDDLKSGDKVGVQSGTTGAIWAEENLVPKGIQIATFDDILAAFGALQAGDVVGVINDAPISQDIAADPARSVTVVSEIQTDEQYGFAFNKGNTDLRDAVNGALAEIKADGTYVEIYKTWFGAEPLSIP